MREISFSVPPSKDGKTVEDFLKQDIGVSSSLLRLLKRTPLGLRADGEHIRSIDFLKQGQTVTLLMPDDEISIQGENFELDILYEDDDLLALNKPSDMALHPTFGYEGKTLAGGVVGYFERCGKKISARPLFRLDRYTSGVVLFAKHQLSSLCLLSDTVKTYHAIVHGKPEGSGVIALPIDRKPEGGITRIIRAGGKYSRTNWKCLKNGRNTSLIKINLDTGRTHQIRVHFKWRGFPLVGDFMYGDPERDSLLYSYSEPLMPRQQLHCFELEFTHPISKKRLTLNASYQEDMQEIALKEGLILQKN